MVVVVSAMGDTTDDLLDLARQVLAWEPQVPLAQGLEPTIADFRARGQWAPAP